MRSIKRRKIFCVGGGHGLEEEGFALIAALLAVWILTAMGVLVFTVTTQDVRVSSRTVGEKKAFSAAESGISWLVENFDPTDLSGSAVSTPQQVDAGGDPNSRYTISAPTFPTTGPAALPLPGYAMGGGGKWGHTRTIATVAGTNSKYSSQVSIQVGIGYGPVDITTIYR